MPMRADLVEMCSLFWRCLFLMMVVAGLSGCSVRTLVVNAIPASLAESGDVFASDEDPELIRDAIPFALKTIETLLAENPDHAVLLLAACRGFTQYSYAFVEIDAERLEDIDFEAAEREYDRALKLYLRARGYCLRLIEQKHPGTTHELTANDDPQLEQFGINDVPLLFWAGASWGGAINVGMAEPGLVADFPAVKRLMNRALELDESYDYGAIHGVMISLEALPESMGGSNERARYHFQRAVELSSGKNAGPYVTLAESVTVADQDWQEFEQLLETALSIDPNDAPSIRLVNILAQERAAWLLDRVEDLFVEYPFDE